MFSRQAGMGGRWVSPSGESFNVSAHAPFAYDELVKMETGPEMSKSLESDPETEEVRQKGKSGEVAKAEGEAKVGDDRNSQRNSEKLVASGWVHVTTGSGLPARFWMASPESLSLVYDDMVQEASRSGEVYVYFGNTMQDAHANSATVSAEDLATNAESAIAIAMNKIRQRSSIDTGGLGKWSGKNEGGIRYFRP